VVDKVVNESVSYPAPAGDFEELHKHIAIAHELSACIISACIVIGSSQFLRVDSVRRTESSLRKPFTLKFASSLFIALESPVD
jgi:hypothetical protein